MISCASSGGPQTHFEPVEGINQKKSTPFCCWAVCWACGKVSQAAPRKKESAEPQSA